MDTSNHKCSYIVVKVASRCNINCTYCYMYNLGDESYRNQPKVMKDNVIDALILRAVNHCKKNNLEHFIMCFHGGEPLLAGKEFFEKFVKRANDSFKKYTTTQLYFGIQTNGILLDEAWCKLFDRLNISVAISLDGDKETNDRYRIDHKGNGTYDRVINGLNNIRKYYDQPNAGYILSVLNIHADPIKVYEHFKSIHIKSTDWLFPDNNYDNPPENPTKDSDTPYGDWLIKVFDHWFKEPDGTRIRIRLFNDLIKQILGHYNSTDAYGSEKNELLVIETNGEIEPVDVLKNCGDSFTKTNVNVLTHEFDDAFENELVEVFENAHQMLCSKCLVCPIKHICGAGYLPHRYSSKNGFNNPSIYCKDLMKLIAHIQNKVIDSLPETLINTTELEKITYDELVAHVAVHSNFESPYAEKLEFFSKKNHKQINYDYV